MLARGHPKTEDQHNRPGEGGDRRLVLVGVDSSGEPSATVSDSPGRSFVFELAYLVSRALFERD